MEEFRSPGLHAIRAAAVAVIAFAVYAICFEVSHAAEPSGLRGPNVGALWVASMTVFLAVFLFGRCQRVLDARGSHDRD